MRTIIALQKAKTRLVKKVLCYSLHVEKVKRLLWIYRSFMFWGNMLNARMNSVQEGFRWMPKVIVIVYDLDKLCALFQVNPGLELISIKQIAQSSKSQIKLCPGNHCHNNFLSHYPLSSSLSLPLSLSESLSLSLSL